MTEVGLLKKSKYSVWVHLNSDEVFGLHGYTGAMILISNELYQILQDGDLEYTRKCFPLEFNGLWSLGFITSLSPEEELEVVLAVHNRLRKQHDKYHFILVPSIDCNFRCIYCFERDLQNSLNGFTKLHMTKDDVDLFYLALDKLQEHYGSKRCGRTITLYGGEPLLSENVELIDYFVRNGQKRQFRFSAITNGYNLDEYFSLISPDAIRSVNISIDGTSACHNLRRPLKDGGGTFEKIISNIQHLLNLDRSVEIAVRINFDESNVSEINKLANQFLGTGWLDKPNFHVIANLVYHKQEGKSCLGLDRELLELAYENNNWLPISLDCFTSKVANKILKAIKHSRPFQFRAGFCAATFGMYVFTPDGKIYKCWEDIGGSQSLIGQYSPTLELDEYSDAIWTSRTLDRLPACQRCPYALICGGGCAIHAHQQLGDFYRGYCDNFDYRFRTSVKQIAQSLILRKEVVT